MPHGPGRRSDGCCRQPGPGQRRAGPARRRRLDLPGGALRQHQLSGPDVGGKDRCGDRVSNSPFRQLTEAPDFWRLWYVGFIVATVRWLETIAVGIVVYQRTDSAFLVSMLPMLRLLPMGLFGAFLGELADRFDRGRTLLSVVVLMS